MANIRVLAGDFVLGDSEYQSGSLILRTSINPSFEKQIPISSFKTLRLECEESNKNIKSAIGFGIAGALLLGPVGAAMGFLLAGRETEVTFIATLKGGRTLLAATDSDTYRDISERFRQ